MILHTILRNIPGLLVCGLCFSAMNDTSCVFCLGILFWVLRYLRERVGSIQPFFLIWISDRNSLIFGLVWCQFSCSNPFLLYLLISRYWFTFEIFTYIRSVVISSFYSRNNRASVLLILYNRSGQTDVTLGSMLHVCRCLTLLPSPRNKQAQDVFGGEPR